MWFICGLDVVMAEKTFGMLLGALIKQKRIAQGLTQLQLSEDAYGNGKRIRRISELETGSVANPHQKTIDPIILVLGITDKEIESCSKEAVERIEDDLTRASREASNLIETLLYRFDHDNPEASLVEADEFLKTKAKEWRQLQKKIQQFVASDERIAALKTKALEALSEGDFKSASSYLGDAEETQIKRETLKQVTKLVELRVLKAHVDLLAGEKGHARAKFVEAANFYAPFDKEAEVNLLDILAFELYDVSRRSTINYFDVADQLLKAALKINVERQNDYSIASFKSKIAMMHRSESTRVAAAAAHDLLAKAIQFCEEALEYQNPENGLNAWGSTKINLGNCLIESSKRSDLKEMGALAERAFSTYNDILTIPNSNNELDELLCHANNGCGNAILQMMEADDVDRSEEALKYYRDCIIKSEISFDADMWGAANINIGNLLASRADSVESDKEAKYLRLKSMGAFLSALEVYPQSFFAYPYAQAHYNLAMVYFRYGLSLRSELTEVYLFKALMSFDAAETVYTEENHPKKWVEIQYFRAMVFSLHAELPNAYSTVYDYDKSVECIEEAVRVCKVVGHSGALQRCQNFLDEVSKRRSDFQEFEKQRSKN